MKNFIKKAQGLFSNIFTSAKLKSLFAICLLILCAFSILKLSSKSLQNRIFESAFNKLNDLNNSLGGFLGKEGFDKNLKLKVLIRQDLSEANSNSNQNNKYSSIKDELNSLNDFNSNLENFKKDDELVGKSRASIESSYLSISSMFFVGTKSEFYNSMLYNLVMSDRGIMEALIGSDGKSENKINFKKAYSVINLNFNPDKSVYNRCMNIFGSKTKYYNLEFENKKLNSIFIVLSKIIKIKTVEKNEIVDYCYMLKPDFGLYKDFLKMCSMLNLDLKNIDQSLLFDIKSLSDASDYYSNMSKLFLIKKQQLSINEGV